MSSPSSPDAAAGPLPATLAIHLDLVGGIAGDMFVAAMVDALPTLAALVLAELAAVKPVGVPDAGFHESVNGGLRARRFGVAPAAEGIPYRAAATAGGATPGTPRAHQSPGIAYTLLRRRLVEASLSTPTRRHALALLALLADAEASVHGIAADGVHFHELGDWNSLMDVVAAGCIAAKLEGAHWTASSLPLGSGTVRTEHGLLPVPAPATAALLSGYAWHDDGIAGERVTPTGAAILRHLVPAAACGARRDPGRLIGVGCGAGTRTLPGLPNIVRVLVLERDAAVGAGVETGVVAVLEFDVDDMTGEEIAAAADRLRSESGVIDVSVGTRQGKKGRPLAGIRLLARPDATDAIARACFTETSTLGLRVREERRHVLRRAEVSATVDGTAVRVKVAERPGGERTAKAAHDDVASTPGLAERRRLRDAATHRALEGGDE